MVNGSSKQEVKLSPNLGVLKGEFVRFCKSAERELKNVTDNERAEVLARLRADLGSVETRESEQVDLMFASSLVLDFIGQGWKLKLVKQEVMIIPPEGEVHASKEQVRRGHLLGRDAQLRETSVSEFVRGMQVRHLYKDSWHSVFSLMRDGRELANKLDAINALTNEVEREEALATVIKPYVQFVEGDATCEYTGLRLGDIWRYFRHTWINEYKSTPGRSMMILIRDAAAPNHPVVGIASLGSSVVQHRGRDEWIGWQSDALLQSVISKPSQTIAQWLFKSLDQMIEGIYVADLIRDGLCKKSDLKKPSTVVIPLLLAEAEEARKKHRQNPQKSAHKGQKNDTNPDTYWKREALTYLYRSKRCGQLAQLLSIRQIFHDNGFTEPKSKLLKTALEKGKVRTAVAQLVRMIKAEHVGVDMMDITVCGAVAPYNAILGGKLICMLLCSPQVTQHYAKRYGDQISVIASSMRGAPVVRKPSLVLLCTTSLYGVGSSQYNRVKIPLHLFGVKRDSSVAYEDLGHSYGFGTYQFSKDTIRLGETLTSRRKDGRLVNSIFGEGVNPLLRKIREALELVGFRSEELLFHGNRRVTYGIKLAGNFREVLLGINTNPHYLIPQSNALRQTERIAHYWRRRWLSRRITRPETLAEVRAHTLAYPMSHGAAVTLEDESDETESRFAAS